MHATTQAQTWSRLRAIPAVILLISLLSASASAQGTPVASPDASASERPYAADLPIRTYEDPDGRFTFPIPDAWTLEEDGGIPGVVSPDGEITIETVVIEASDIEAAIVEAWAIAAPDAELGEPQTLPGPPVAGAEDAASILYLQADPTATIHQAFAWSREGSVYVMLLTTDPVAFQQRAAPANLVVLGFRFPDVPQPDATGVEPARFEGSLVGDFEAAARELLAESGIPGISVAVVQGGEVVYEGAFGTTELGGEEPITPETPMLIGSTTKSFTTMLLASLVDEGAIAWDTPVRDVLPGFTLSDPELTERVTVRDLVCNCTGVARQDYEILFTSDTNTATGFVDDLASYPVFTEYGEAFQYSNQMVSAGGIVAGTVLGGEAEPQAAYVQAVEDRILGPAGMDETTFSFAEATAGGDHAVPHGLALDGSYAPLDVAVEEAFSEDILASGGLWSTAADMADYALLGLGRGTTPSGEEVVSAENLGVTWTPQIVVDPLTAYGLGWFIEDYGGIPIVQHGGNMLGFTSDFALVPDDGFGIVVLSNAQASNALNVTLRTMILDAVYGQTDDAPAGAGTPAATPVTTPAAATPVASPAATDATPTPGTGAMATPAATPGAGVDLTTLAGTWENDALGAIEVASDGASLTMENGVVPIVFVPAGDGVSLVSMSAPLAGVPLTTVPDIGDGRPGLVFGIGVYAYVFTPAAA